MGTSCQRSDDNVSETKTSYYKDRRDISISYRMHQCLATVKFLVSGGHTGRAVLEVPRALGAHKWYQNYVFFYIFAKVRGPWGTARPVRLPLIRSFTAARH